MFSLPYPLPANTEGDIVTGPEAFVPGQIEFSIKLRRSKSNDDDRHHHDKDIREANRMLQMTKRMKRTVNIHCVDKASKGCPWIPNCNFLAEKRKLVTSLCT